MKVRTRFALGICAIGMLLSACDRIRGGDNSQFSGEHAHEMVAEQLEFGPRVPGSNAHTNTSNWIVNELKQLGWDVRVQNFEKNGRTGKNIIGYQDRTAEEWVVLGAHYDSRPIADMDTENQNEPVPGANDGASGVAILLELARVLMEKPVNVDVSLVFFDLEDGGAIDGQEWIVGSTYFVSALVLFPDEAVIVDMVGDQDLTLYYERNSNSVITEEIWSVADELGYDEFIPEYKHSYIDDHTPFVREGIPAIVISDYDYPAWHTTSDTIDKVSAASLEAVGRTLESWLDRK